MRQRERRAEPGLDQRQQPVDGQRQRRRGGAADQHAHPVLGLQAGEDEVAEARLADRRRERRGADRPDRGGADAGEDHRRAERQLDQSAAAGGAVMPMPSAASSTPGSIPCSAATPLRTIGSSA